MAKKGKLDLSGEGLKRMALNHCEKVVFGLCALVLLYLVYAGYSKPTFDDSQDFPQKLITSADQTRKTINNTEWGDPDDPDTVSFALYRKPRLGIPTLVEKMLADRVDSSVYPAPAFGSPSESSKAKRLMPEFLAATDVRAQFTYQLFGIAEGVPGGKSAINKAMFAPLVEEEKAKPRRRSGSSRNNNNNFGSSQNGYGEDDQNKDDEESSPGAGGSMPGSGAGMSGGGGAGGGAGSGASMPDGPVKTTPEYITAELEGVPASGFMPGGKPMWRQVICVTALVPYRQQLENYEKTLRGTRRYDPAVDVPKYIGVVIQRRVDGGEWKDITSEVKRFSGRVTSVTYPNLVAADQYDPFLNAQIPTMMMSNFDKFVVHPKINLRDFLAMEEEAEATEKKSEDKTESSDFSDFEDAKEDESKTDENGDEVEEIVDYPTSKTAPEFKHLRFFDLLVNVKQGAKLEYKVSTVLSNPNLPLSFIAGDEFTSSKRGSGKSDDMGGGNRDGLMSGGGGGMMPGSGGGGSGGGMMPGSGGGGSGGSGSGRMGGSGGGNSAAELSAQLTLELLGNANLTDRDLDGSIRSEILKIRDLGPADLEESDVAQKYGIVCPESSVSNVVEFSNFGEQYFTGPVKPLSIRRAENVEFFDASPKGEVVVKLHDPAFDLKIPGKAEVTIGSPLVFDARAEVFNPIDWSVRWVGDKAVDDDEKEIRKDYSFRTDALVLDITPPMSLDIQADTDDELYSPAEILIFDGKGGFMLRNELDDLRDYNHALLVPDDGVAGPAKAAGSTGSNRGGLSGGSGGEMPGSGGSSPDGGAGGFPGF